MIGYRVPAAQTLQHRPLLIGGEDYHFFGLVTVTAWFLHRRDVANGEVMANRFIKALAQQAVSEFKGASATPLLPSRRPETRRVVCHASISAARSFCIAFAPR